MVAIDTNVLTRLVVDDPEAMDQCVDARRAVSSAIRAGHRVYISPLVLVESLWVLRRVFKLTNPDLVAVVEGLLRRRAYKVGETRLVRAALGAWQQHGADFSDHVIREMAAREKALPLITFDEKLLKVPDTRAP